MNVKRDPPYPADTRAKGWRFELDYERIEQSDTWAMASEVHMAKHSLLMMWLVSWQQVPCGSFPNSEELIRVKCFIPKAVWSKCRDVLMRGWWIASDGRMYHPAVTERVQEMLEYRRKNADRVAKFKALHKEERASNALPERERRDSNDTGTGTGTFSSESTILQRESPDKPAKPARTRKPKAVETLIPEGFGISESVREWAAGKGYERLDDHLDAFVEKAKAKGYVYADWDAAFRNAVREDWAHVRSNGRGGPPIPAGERATKASSAADETKRLLQSYEMTPEERAASDAARRLAMSSIKTIGHSQ